MDSNLVPAMSATDSQRLSSDSSAVPQLAATHDGLEDVIIRKQDVAIGSVLGRGTYAIAMNCTLPAVAKVSTWPG